MLESCTLSMLRVVVATQELNTQNFSVSCRQDINKYRSLFPHVSAAIQATVIPAVVLGTLPLKGDTIQYI